MPEEGLFDVEIFLPREEHSQSCLCLHTSLGVPIISCQQPPSERRKEFLTHVTNGLSLHYHLDESTFSFRVIMSKFSFLFHFSMKFLYANRIPADETPPTFCGISSGAILFAFVPKKRMPGLCLDLWKIQNCTCTIK